MITLQNYHYIHRIAKRTLPYLKKENRFTKILKADGKSDRINHLITEKIKEGKPLMVARYGSTECSILVNYDLVHQKTNDIEGIYKYLTGKINVYWKKHPKFLNNLMELSGFFPNSETELDKFVKLYAQCAKNLDILGIWNDMEEHIKEIPDSTTLCKLRELEPWFFDNPWTKELQDKKVLVIHPFEESIIYQYKGIIEEKRRKDTLYKNPNILPNFELKTIKAVQTIAGEKSEFDTWFDALDSMKEKIDKTDFDVAIIGCGAYGFPLASYVKDIGKQAIHLGGVTQLLFGIKGKRWEDWEEFTSLRKNNGENWIYAKEIPKDFKKVEGGCYW